ncbi:hypothetical protein MO973_33605 [Paenibacillus sp. TRM 82003]|nr:hypothetical protein [Paenibacillus sp. TRM 82003]
MFEIGAKYVHIITREVMHIYFVYRSAVTEQVTGFDLVSSVAKDAASEEDIHYAIRKLDDEEKRKILHRHVSFEEFMRYYDPYEE